MATIPDAPKVSPTVKGSIRLKTSAKAETAAHTVKIGAAAENVGLGPFDVSVSAQRQTLRVKLTGPGELIASFTATADGQKLSTSHTRFTSAGYTGNFSFSTQSAESSGSTTRTSFNQGASFSDFMDSSAPPPTDGENDSRTYSLPLPKNAGEATITLTYWSDPREQTVPFETKVF